jgi:hypothetical protein
LVFPKKLGTSDLPDGLFFNSLYLIPAWIIVSNARLGSIKQENNFPSFLAKYLSINVFNTNI